MAPLQKAAVTVEFPRLGLNDLPGWLASRAHEEHGLDGAPYIVMEYIDGGTISDLVREPAGPRVPIPPEIQLEVDIAAGERVDSGVLRPVADPFSPDSGLRMLSGNLGRAVIKVSAVKPEHRRVEAPAVVFASQAEFMQRYKAGELDRDFVAVLRFQGPKANGMPELHQLTPALANLQDKGRAVALVTDGRMSGASGKVPAAIHCSPEALPDGPLARLRDGDVVRVCGRTGQLEALDVDLAARGPVNAPPPPAGTGRELFAMMRRHCDDAEAGASAMLALMEEELG